MGILASIRAWLIGWLSVARQDAAWLWVGGGPGERALYVAGAVLVLLGLLHVPVHLIDDRAWEGPLAWRKPILFGLATGVTLWSIGYGTGMLRSRALRLWIALPLSFAALVEVGLIALQPWRGEPSHFNTSTPINAAIYYTIEASAIGLTLLIGLLCFSAMGRLRSYGVDPAAAEQEASGLDAHPPAPMALAVRSGLWLLLVGCFLGLYMVLYGQQRVAQGQSPGIYGEQGVLKFVHGTPLHAIQWLVLLAWALRHRGLTEANRWGLIALAVAGQWLALAYAAIQTFAGRSRLDLTIPSSLVLSLALLSTVIPVAVAIAGRPRQHPGRGAAAA